MDDVRQALAGQNDKKRLSTLLKDLDSKAEQILGWKAQISLRQGLERTLPWFKEVLGY